MASRRSPVGTVTHATTTCRLVPPISCPVANDSAHEACLEASRTHSLQTRATSRMVAGMLTRMSCVLVWWLG